MNDQSVHGVLVGFEADVLEQLRHAVAGNRPPFLPVRRMDDLLHARQQYRVEVMTDLDEDVLAPFVVGPIEVEDGMTGRAGAREEIERNGVRAATRGPQAVFDEADRLGEVEILFSEQILQRLRAEIGGCVPRIVPPRPRQGFDVHVNLEVRRWSCSREPTPADCSSMTTMTSACNCSCRESPKHRCCTADRCTRTPPAPGSAPAAGSAPESSRRGPAGRPSARRAGRRRTAPPAGGR